MKKYMRMMAVLGLSLLCATGLEAQKIQPIETPVPVRPAGQKDVLLLTVPKMKTVRVGFIGLGMRGPTHVNSICNIEGTEIKALCDIEQKNVEKCQEMLAKYGRPKATEYYGSADAYKKLCERKDIDLVYIATDWVNHVPIALYAMNHGKNVAIEVPAALNMKDIWSLINASERTRKHCMMLENCCYDFFELATLNMAQKGLFGTVEHVEGAYIHNLGDFWDSYWNNWRLEFNEKHRGDVYPTHGLGPVCLVLNIHRGDRLKYLVSMDTKPLNGQRYAKKQSGKDSPNFQNGDETSTLIRTELGKTILIEHNVMTPHPYNRMHQIMGTDGFAAKYPVEQLCLAKDKLKEAGVANYDKIDVESALPSATRDWLLQKYTPEFVKTIEAKAKKVGGHGGMDFIMSYRLIYCLQNGLPLDEDVYDMAEWCCMTELTKISIENNSAPVAIPDFTRGAWNRINGFSYHFAE